MQQTTVEGVRIAWTRTDPHTRREAGRALIAALATALAPELVPGTDVRIVQRCATCGGPHGRPLLPGMPVIASVAYAAEWVIVAVAHRDDATAVGIDLELAAATPDLAALFAPADPPDLRGWTAIEAVLKADGRGLLVAPDQVRLSPDGSRASIHGGREFLVHPIHAAPGMIATLAVSPPPRGR